ncbi:MAG: hypothetical protein KBS57_06025 [Alistipes sp.]|nr:hypothetical protein [Candidatus Minthomonas equi]
MSQNTCKRLLGLSIVLLVLLTLFAPPDISCVQWQMNPTVSCILSLSFLIGTALLISYINRAVFVVYSDRFTLPSIYLLISLSDFRIFFFSKYHIVAVLSLIGVSFILRFLIREDVSKSDYFIWALMMSIAALFVPQMIWILIPGLLVAFDKGSEQKSSLSLITFGSILIPLFYLSSFNFIFGGTSFAVTVSDRLSSAVDFEFPKVSSMVRLSYAFIMGAVILCTVYIVWSKFDAIRNSNMRKQSGFIFPYLIFMTVLLLFSADTNGPKILILAVPWSLLFVYYGELSSFVRIWKHLVLMVIVSTMIIRVYEII